MVRGKAGGGYRQGLGVVVIATKNALAEVVVGEFDLGGALGELGEAVIDGSLVGDGGDYVPCLLSHCEKCGKNAQSRFGIKAE
jgi:hypothetical protein